MQVIHIKIKYFYNFYNKRFFIDFLLGYKKNFLITSNFKAGKSCTLRYKIRKLLENNIYSIVSMAITENTGIEKVNIFFSGD